MALATSIANDPFTLGLDTHRTCDCPPKHLNCLTAKEWLKCQLGVWQFNYSGRDIRNKRVHPATFPSLCLHESLNYSPTKGN